MLKCICGFNVPLKAKFCPDCGEPAPKMPEIPKFADELIIRQINPLLTPDEAAELLRISRWKLDALRVQHKLPESSYVWISGNKKKTFRYRARELLSWAGTIEGPITTAG